MPPCFHSLEMLSLVPRFGKCVFVNHVQYLRGSLELQMYDKERRGKLGTNFKAISNLVEVSLQITRRPIFISSKETVRNRGRYSLKESESVVLGSKDRCRTVSHVTYILKQARSTSQLGAGAAALHEAARISSCRRVTGVIARLRQQLLTPLPPQSRRLGLLPPLLCLRHMDSSTLLCKKGRPLV